VRVRLDHFEAEFGDSGLVRPDIAKDMPITGEVVGVGPGVYKKRGKKHVFIPTTLKIGQRVYIPWATGVQMKYAGALHVQLSEDQILAVEE
jgi:chaperonin GroES